MNNRHLFNLAPCWMLGADSNQWMLLCARKRHAEVTWQPVAYVGSTKLALRCCMRENGVQPTLDAQAMLDALPERFLDWRAMLVRENKPNNEATDNFKQKATE